MASPDAKVQCNLGNHLAQAPILGRSKLRHRKVRKTAWGAFVAVSSPETKVL